MNDGNVLKSEYVKEQKHYTRQELAKIFDGKNTEELTKIIKLLRYHKLLKIRKNNDTSAGYSDMADEVVDVTDAIADVSGYQYVFTGVGLFIIGGIVLKCYPKYIDDVSDEKELVCKFKRVLKVLEKYNTSKQDVNMLTDVDGEKGFNLLEVILYLMCDYYEHGLYHNHKNIIESNGTGTILWDRTVNQEQPLIVDNRPYYTELLTRKRVDEHENYFRRLHECILTECSRIFAKHNLFEFFEITPIELTDAKIEDFGDKDYILYMLERELGEQFHTRKQQLLKTMHTYISNNKGAYDNDCLMVYGTTSFHKVWEEVCATVMQNDLENTLNALGDGNLGPLHESYLIHKDKELLSIIEKPEWISYSGVGVKGVPQKADTLVPDIISILKCADEKWFGIFDAKYYTVQYTPLLAGQPGIGDITKQYLYNLAYKDFIEKHNFNLVLNCFLMPVDGVEFIKRGYTNLKILQFFNLGSSQENEHYKNQIDIILMPADTMYEWYLSNQKVDEVLFNNLLMFIGKDDYGQTHKPSANS